MKIWLIILDMFVFFYLKIIKVLFFFLLISYSQAFLWYLPKLSWILSNIVTKMSVLTTENPTKNFRVPEAQVGEISVNKVFRIHISAKWVVLSKLTTGNEDSAFWSTVCFTLKLYSKAQNISWLSSFASSSTLSVAMDTLFSWAVGSLSSLWFLSKQRGAGMDHPALGWGFPEKHLVPAGVISLLADCMWSDVSV